MRYLAAVALAALVAAPALAVDAIEDAAGTATWNYNPQTPGEIWERPAAILYDNGPLITCPGCGSGGADESQLQVAVLGMNTLGFGHQFALGFGIADDFMIPAGETWTIDTATTFAYQTNSGPASTITGVYITIYDGVPGAGGTPVFGDYTTNVMGATAFSNIYRVTDTTSGATSRPIMAQDNTLGAVLTDGQYWMGWSTNGSGSSGPWAPPVTIVGQATTGDGYQSTDGAYMSWALATDSGTLTGQGFPFILDGSIGGATPTEEVTWSSLKKSFND